MTYIIETVNGAKYSWQKFPGLHYRGVTTYCADGDGFIEVREINGCFGLYDQNQRIRSFQADNLSDALRYAELYAEATYPSMLDPYTIED